MATKPNEVKNNKRVDEDDDLDEDESLSERLFGLSEMFPDSVKSTCSCVCNFMVSATKGSYWAARNILWVASASAVILVLPVIFETERAQQQEEQLQQQRQILLGPNAAVSGSGAASGNLLPAMGMAPPPIPK